MTTGLYPQELVISFPYITSVTAISTKTANGKPHRNRELSPWAHITQQCNTCTSARVIVAMVMFAAVRKMVIEGSNQTEGPDFDMIMEKGKA